MDHPFPWRFLSILIGLLSLGYGGFLLFEVQRLRRDRASFDHVIHVQGTRGKSTVTRLIGAILREAGIPTYTKVTGTVAATIDCQGIEQPIRRLGRANIREQAKMMHQARLAGSKVLVIECMAVTPELAELSEKRMLKADWVVLTQSGVDHQEAGQDAHRLLLEAVLPNQGTVFCLDEHVETIKPFQKERGFSIEMVHPKTEEDPSLHPSNLALARAVGRQMHVPDDTIEAGLKKAKPDPGVVQTYHRADKTFVSLFAVNDPGALKTWFEHLQKTHNLKAQTVTVLLANRFDRPLRTLAQLQVIESLSPQEVFVAGPYFRRVKKMLSKAHVAKFTTFEALPKGIIIGVGNMHPMGFKAHAFFSEEGG